MKLHSWLVQKFCITEDSRWIPSSSRHFNMSVVTPEKPRDLLFFIFIIAFQISSIVGGPDRSFAVGFCSRFSKMVGSMWVFQLKNSENVSPKYLHLLRALLQFCFICSLQIFSDYRF